MADAVSLIVNPSAGGGRALRIAPLAADALRRRGVDVATTRTEDLRHAGELAVAAALQGRAAVTVGGDGLIGVVADALRHLPDSVIGLIPGGRGNDLARTLGIPDDAEGAATVVASGAVRRVDLGAVSGADGDEDGRAFVGIASVGFDSDANRIANEAPSWLGGGVYAYGALRALARWRPAEFSVRADGEEYEFRGYTVAVANSRAYGGGMFVAPDAMLDDGLLDVVCVGESSKLQFLKGLPKVFKGEHVDEEHVRVLRGAEIEVTADRPFTMFGDGDPIGDLPVTVRSLHGAVRMIVPAQGAAALSPEDGP